jgi:hypothetical protein
MTDENVTQLTPEMIKAGVEAWDAINGFHVAGRLSGQDVWISRQATVEAIYKAMESARKST